VDNHGPPGLVPCTPAAPKNKMSTISTDLWQRCCALLAAELPDQQFNTWIRPLQLTEAGAAAGARQPTLVGHDGEPLGEAEPLVLALLAQNHFKRDWIRDKYASRIAALLGEIAGRPVRLEIGLAAVGRPTDPAGLTGPTAAASAAGPAQPQAPGAHQRLDAAALLACVQDAAAQAGHVAGTQPMVPTGSTPARGTRLAAPATTTHRLNPALTFDTLVAGRANQMARTAALHVAGAPGQMYNPLFIYGGVGLGKTHLIHAVGNALLKDRPDARVLYLHAEQFISDVVKNYQRKTFDELKAKYHHLDLLLIDDVQFFAGKERTQEEFFNAFEALLAKRAHIIMTSDTYPKGLPDIDERLTSRFDAGLTVAIEPPELEMRVAILIKKSLAEGTSMPEDVAFFVAKNVRANVRELEGALRKVLAYSRFSQKDINIALAREALKDLLSIQNRQISVENIQKTVADFYKIKVADMYSKKRPASIARPRQIAMYLAKDMTKKSLPEIGELFGGRDHTTVLHAVRKIGDERQRNSELNQQLHVLEQTLKG
jgi:chromosomal replication initiator protein